MFFMGCIHSQRIDFEVNKMREPRYSILSDINDGIDRAKQGKLALYWQRNIEHEYRCKKVTPAEQQAYTDLPFRSGAMRKNCAPAWRVSVAASGSVTSGKNMIRWCSLLKIAAASLRLLTFWIRMSPQRCERRLHSTYNSSLLNVCRSGMFRL